MARHPGSTPRRSIVMDEEYWEPFKDLAEKRHLNASLLIRHLVIAELEKARAAGEIPKKRRTK